ncbi:glycosyltransferase family 4 protein [Mucilaginibacter jinjuensis]|uniref:Glycosyltransferase family 1 protein n=1 Tax=Mucilaginibacter jinjuensis TaxID=1176721 RepID=A0ABY7TGT3_9SPHI|nr:glycosyltransferase family 1 protein [Mucilaginibacter jinjuensis]WCT14918.1 glycosyltransferase family 1 protein [Mucilaginibacter jinjuensis]
MVSITIDARMIDASGIGVYLENILEQIVSAYKVILLGDPDKLAAYQHTAQIIPFFAPIYSIKEQIAFKNIIPECDIFWSPHYNVPLFSIKAKKRVATIHDVYHLAFSQELGLLKRLYARMVMNVAVKLSSRIITVSEFSKKELLKYTKSEDNKITVIYNGVDHHVKINSFEDLKEKYKIPDKYILYVGNVKPHKNLRKLLEAYLLLDPSLYQKYKVVIVGQKHGFITGDLALIKWIDNTPRLADNVIFTGFADHEDMDTLYYYASVFVFPSIYEGFGLPPLEAMANGCPVIVSNESCLPEICGDAALYFNPFDEREISNKISTVLKSRTLPTQLIERGIQHASKFSWEKSGRIHIGLFNSL